MKFDIVIGNPPYNKAIYKRFIELAVEKSKLGHSLIIPNTWSDSKDTVLSVESNKITDMVYYLSARDIFDIDQFGGICYYFFSKSPKTFSTLVVNKYFGKTTSEHRELEFKSTSETKGNYIGGNGDIVLLNTAYSILQKIQSKLGNNIEVFNIDGEIYKYDSGYNLNMQDDSDIRLIYDGELLGFINRDELKEDKKVDEYKLYTHERLGFGSLPNGNKKLLVLKQMQGALPGQIPIWPYVVIASEKNRDDLSKFFKYYQTKFMRYLVLAGNTSSHIKRQQTWRLVPSIKMMTAIDWTKDIQDIDNQLYKKFNLTDIEIADIETLIKYF